MLSDELKRITGHELEERQPLKHRLHVCMGTGCISAGSDRVKTALETELRVMNLDGTYAVTTGGCRGLCAAGPLVAIDGDTNIAQRVTTENVPELVQRMTDLPDSLRLPTEMPFFRNQKKVVLEYSGNLDPNRIDDYITAGGYTALNHALTEMTPAQTVDEIMRSGLRGRGGAGYPTGLKWQTVAKAHGERKFVICNGDEGDPGAFMDRSVMEDYPFKVLEGVTIAGYAIGAQQGYLYVRAEYPLAVKRLKSAIRQAEKIGLLGSNIGGTPFSFNIDVRLGAGAFVCGEETALIASIEGKRGHPRPRPPYPAARGLWGCPTLINNVETFSSIAPIIRQGADWFAGIGTEKSKGTKVFALSGRVNYTGLIEVPMGTTLREIVFEIGGGIPDGRQFKAIQTGGPSGGCIPAEFLDTPVDYESLAALGSIMGSGGMIVMDDTSCMVDVARYFMEFCKTESCGKCAPCRIGTAQMHDLLTIITAGQATLEDLERLEKLCDMVRSTSLCGLGQSAPNPVISTLRYFRHEYVSHIVDHHCPAGVCSALSQPQEAAE
ncbi:MAG: NAD(P)H-dependent oxidoreductase subunit E [Anaerolineae bacterium]|nr:NAD(P)H-dependent oxidoreductase subunit E [Anaerolineae bacterium]